MVKICPQCNSAYTDESLQYCLSDGTPLVVSENNSASWHSAETIYDPNIIIHQSSPHQTSPNSQSPTNSSIQVNSGNFQNNQQSNNLLMYLGLAILLGGIGFGSYWIFFKEAPKETFKASQLHTTETKRPIVQLLPEQESQINKEVTALLQLWNTTNEQRKIDEHIKCYADTLDVYYKESGKDKNHVKADRIRAYERYETIDLQIDNVKISPTSENSAIAIIDKTWTFKNPKKISTGSVQQQLDFAKKDGKWFINGEQDLKVYYINNRENGDTNTSNTNQ
ncbi:MAG: hypothetical protein MUC29_06695 [Pyrinomonadaceae bacterium]|jgi:hypothetical protein|nr:hypothetical protein [Pyrinomonadaceae bacterium]